MAAKASYLDFKRRTIGRQVDVDGIPVYQPWQCYDEATEYFKYVGGFQIYCPSGYVIDIAERRETNGILQFCYDIGLQAELQQGDICVWGRCAACPDSHIAIYDHDDGQDAVYFLGQNQPNPIVTVARIPVEGIIGVFRPKIFAGGTPGPKPDQILSVGSIVRSYGFHVEAVDAWNDTMYNSWVGGWIPCADVDEIDAADGSCDQILHYGAGVKFRYDRMTVGEDPALGYGVDAANDTVYIEELGYWVKASCLEEIED